MAHVRLGAGAEFDILSSAEHRSHMERLRDELCGYLDERDGTTEIRASAPFNTDGSGNTSSMTDGGAGVYRVPTGYNAFLLRLSLDYETSNPEAPFACGVRICADAVTPAALRALTTALPNVYSASRSHAPLFRAGQRVMVGIQSGPTSTSIYATVQMLLIPNKHRVRHDTLEATGA